MLYIFVFYLLHTNLYCLPDTTINVGPLLYLYTHCTDIIVQVMYICPFLCSLSVVVNECMEDPSLWRAHTFQCIILVPVYFTSISILTVASMRKHGIKNLNFSVKKYSKNCTIMNFWVSCCSNWFLIICRNESDSNNFIFDF